MMLEYLCLGISLRHGHINTCRSDNGFDAVIGWIHLAYHYNPQMEWLDYEDSANLPD